MFAVQNPLRPRSGDSLRVWEIADQLTEETGRKAQRRHVLKKAVEQGINERTASKQFNDWQNAHKNEREDHGFSEMASVPFSIQLEIKSDGRVLIPAEMRALMKLGGDGRVNAELVDGELRLFSPMVALEKMWRYVKENDQGTGSAADELMAERRAEAARE